MPVVQFCNVCYWTCALWISLWLLKLGARLGQVLLELQTPWEGREAVGTMKSCGSDIWLSPISPHFSLWGKNFAPRWLLLQWFKFKFPRPDSTLLCPLFNQWPQHWVCRIWWLHIGSQDNLDQEGPPCSQGDTPRRRVQMAGNSEERWALSLAVSHCSQKWLGGTWSGAFSPHHRENTGWYPAIINRFVSSIDLSER